MRGQNDRVNFALSTCLIGAARPHLPPNFNKFGSWVPGRPVYTLRAAAPRSRRLSSKFPPAGTTDRLPHLQTAGRYLGLTGLQDVRDAQIGTRKSFDICPNFRSKLRTCDFNGQVDYFLYASTAIIRSHPPSRYYLNRMVFCQILTSRIQFTLVLC